MATAEQNKQVKKVKRPTEQKRQIQNKKRRLINKAVRTRVRTGAKAFLGAVQEKNLEKGQDLLETLYSLVDKSVKKGVFTKNKASRIKSRMALKLRASTV